MFVGQGGFDVRARGDVTLGPVANPFLLPEGYSNTFWDKTYFSTYAANDAVQLSSLSGSITLRTELNTSPLGGGTDTPLLQAWLVNVLGLSPTDFSSTISFYQPWLRPDESDLSPFATIGTVMPATLKATAFSGDINLAGNLTLAPSPTGTVELLAGGAIKGLQPNGLTNLNGTATRTWQSSIINLSDADPNAIPGPASPFGYQSVVGATARATIVATTDPTFLRPLDTLFQETGSTTGAAGALQEKETLHAPGPLHADDASPLRLYSLSGDISGLTLFSGKASRVVAGQDLTDVAFYIQNDQASDVSVISAGRDIIAYDPNSTLRGLAGSVGNLVNVADGPLAGDLQISGPGAVEVLAGRNFQSGIGPNNPDGTGVGLNTIGNGRNPFLPFEGASIVLGAGLGTAADGLEQSNLDFVAFTREFLDPSTDAGRRYLPELSKMLAQSGTPALASGLTSSDPQTISTALSKLSAAQRDLFTLQAFYLVLRDAGRDHSNSTSAAFGTYTAGTDAIAKLFGSGTRKGDINLTSREVKTESGGDVSILAPGGSLTVGVDLPATNPAVQGIFTQSGGNIGIVTDGNVNVGTSRIFTLHGGNEIIWSSSGDIAAGASPKTVTSAPPTRVLIDPQSGDVETDLAGLATGGGIGVLATLANVPAGDVDLIAVKGNVDAGDAGIRVTGNLNIAAVQVLNAGNIQAGGSTSGVPAVAAPSVPSLSVVAPPAPPQAQNPADEAAAKQAAASNAADQVSVIMVEVIGFGGDDGTSATP